MTDVDPEGASTSISSLVWRRVQNGGTASETWPRGTVYVPAADFFRVVDFDETFFLMRVVGNEESSNPLYASA